MLAVQPFRFDCDFREHHRSRAELEQEVAALRLKLDMVRNQARAEGAADALALLQAERDTAQLAASEALAAALADLARRFAETEQAVARLGAELALDLADHLAARALERDPAAAVDEALGRALRQVRRGRPIEVRVAPALVDSLQKLVDQRQEGDRRRLFVSLIEDPSLEPGDARIEWEGGWLLLDRDSRRRAVADEIANALAG